MANTLAPEKEPKRLGFAYDCPMRKTQEGEKKQQSTHPSSERRSKRAAILGGAPRGCATQ
eukprot:12903875-Prorocentrum_lima.AAC.1